MDPNNNYHQMIYIFLKCLLLMVIDHKSWMVIDHKKCWLAGIELRGV
jgi:hypothetical protein